jgi:hypothetical protein
MDRPLACAALTAALMLCACDRNPGTSVTINTADDNGAVAMSDNGQSGQVALNLPGFSGKVTLPKLHLDGDDVEFNGVHLYPGSKVTGMNVDASDDRGTVHIDFDSPADPATVKRWFKDKLGGAKFTLHDAGSGLAGTTDEGKPFTLDLRPAGGGAAQGTIVVG